MRNKRGLSSILSIDRKTLYMVLSVLVLSIFTLTMAYAVLSTTLQINGQAEVSAANWDIHLDNVVLNNSSATTTVPTITDPKTATFTTTLSEPGDFYEFTIDVVNDGSIDAMIDSVTKTPELSDTQKKYLNYIVEYQNGEDVTSKQLVSKNSYVRLKVKVEFRKDITASDLPTTSETLNLAFTVNYTQADETGTNVTDNGVIKKAYDVISGDGTQVGDEICIGQECFYVISRDEDSVTMLAKYNLEVGNVCTSSPSCTLIENPSGIQDSEMIGRPSDNSYPRYGTTAFSSTNYWHSGGLKAEYGTSYPAYVYDSNSTLYNYVESYRTYLEIQGAEIEEARLIKMEELEALGCSRDDNSCSEAPEWVYRTSYWSGAADAYSYVWFVDSRVEFSFYYDNDFAFGVRPVITLTL